MMPKLHGELDLLISVTLTSDLWATGSHRPVRAQSEKNILVFIWNLYGENWRSYGTLKYRRLLTLIWPLTLTVDLFLKNDLKINTSTKYYLTVKFWDSNCKNVKNKIFKKMQILKNFRKKTGDRREPKINRVLPHTNRHLYIKFYWNRTIRS